MSLPSLLQQLHHLDRSLSSFHDRLSSILYGAEYRQDGPNLQGDDLVRLVDYLDKARRCIPLPTPHLSQCRLSIVSILPVSLSGSASTSSKAYAAIGRCRRPRTPFLLHF